MPPQNNQVPVSVPVPPAPVYQNAPMQSSVPGKGDKSALIGFILGLISIVAWIIPIIGFPVTICAIIFSSIGLKSKTRRGKAITGLVLGIIFFIASLFNSIIGSVLAGINSYQSQVDLTTLIATTTLVTQAVVATTTSAPVVVVPKVVKSVVVIPKSVTPVPITPKPVVNTDPNLITFDDLKPTDTSGGYATSGIIPDGYHGLVWNKPDPKYPTYKNNFVVIDSTDATQLSGYHTGVVSPKNAISCTYTNCRISSETVFDLQSFYATAAWNDGLNLNVQGYGVGGGIVCGNSQSVKTINATKPVLVNVNCKDVSYIEFWTNELGSAVHPGYNHGSSGNFVIDNISIQ